MFRWAAPIISCLLLCGVALAAQGEGVWLDVPFIRQPRNGCGAASLAMVMEYWTRQQPSQPGQPAPGVDEIDRALYSPGAGGIYASEMERYLRQHGFRTFAIRGEWSDLRQHLEKGRPLIVALRSGDTAVQDRAAL